MAKKTNFEVNGKNYYRVTKTIGHKADGSPIRKTFYGSGINEANQKADEYLRKLKLGLIETDYSFDVMMHKWLFDNLYNSSKIKSSSFARYDSVYNTYIKNKEIGKIKCTEVKTLTIQEYINKLSVDHSYNQMATLRRVLVTFFNWCIDTDYMTKNPASRVVIKGNKSNIQTNTRKDVIILNKEEIKSINEQIKNTDFELIFKLDLTTGLRRGELLALNWEDIDFDNQTLSVNKAYEVEYYYEDTKRKKKWSITTPKTQNSYRTIPIPEDTLKLLEKHKSSGRIFNTNGDTLYKRWLNVLKQCDIPHKKFHTIRHTYGSILLQNGVDIQTVSELMGHTAIRNNTNLYAL